MGWAFIFNVHVPHFSNSLVSPSSGVVLYEAREADGFSSWLSSIPSDLSKKSGQTFRSVAVWLLEGVFQNGRSYGRQNIKMPKYCQDVNCSLGHKEQKVHSGKFIKCFVCKIWVKKKKSIFHFFVILFLSKYWE